jgi:hypothetical protein
LRQGVPYAIKQLQPIIMGEHCFALADARVHEVMSMSTSSRCHSLATSKRGWRMASSIRNIER